VPFVARGTYVAPVGRDATDRLVALLGELRAAFYSESDRKGVRASALRVTQADQQSVSEAILDDAERRVAELVAKLRDYSTRGPDGAPVRDSTLANRQAEAEALIREINAQAALLGDWGQRFAVQAASLRDSFARALAGISCDLPDWAFGEAEGEAEEAPIGFPEPPPPPAPAPEAPPAEPVTAGLAGVFDF
jgi:hypothetical protein